MLKIKEKLAFQNELSKTMNLCGGIANFNEPELLLDIPNEQFAAVTSRRKSSTPSSSRRSSSSRKLPPTHVDTERRTPTGSGRTPSSGRPSSRSRSRRSTPTAASPHNMPSPTFLNPISRDDLRKKSRSRQHPTCPPLHGMKTVSGMVKKLEAGFELVSSSFQTKKSHRRKDPRNSHFKLFY